MLAGDIAREIRYAMRLGEDQDDGSYLSAMDVINQAGQRLVTAKRWKFLDGGVTTLTFDSENMVALPADFSELTSAYFTDRCAAIITNEAEVLQAQIGSQLNHVAVIGKATATGLAYYLVCSGRAGQDIKITYRRGWLRVEKDEDPILMPEWMRPLLAELCRRYAELVEGTREEGVGPSVVDAVIAGPLMREAAIKDGNTQSIQAHGYGWSGHGYTSIYVPVGGDWLTPNG